MRELRNGKDDWTGFNIKLDKMISTKTHGIIDYTTGILLLAAPYVFGFATGGIEQWLPMALGAATIGMSLITNYELSLAKLIPLPVHLMVDIGSGALLAASPWLFGFSGIIWWPHVAVGLMEIIVPLMTTKHSQHAYRHV